MKENISLKTASVTMSKSTALPVAPPKLTDDRRKKLVVFGNGNAFPRELLNTSGRSPVNSAIIASTVDYICGKGVKGTSKNSGGAFIGAPNFSESWDDIIPRIALDYKQSGSFYLQIRRVENTSTVVLFHQDWSEVRVCDFDEGGAPLLFKIHKDWSKESARIKPVELPAWPGSLDLMDEGVTYLYHHWDYVPGMPFYSLPDWHAALSYVRSDGNLGAFYENSINNNFTASVVVSMPSNPDDNIKEEIQNNFEQSFTGTNGAASVVMLWGESEEVRPKVDAFKAEGNANIYDSVESIVFQKIISAHRLSSPTLAGVSGSGNLSGNAAEIIDAYILYNYTVIERKRQTILDALNIFTRINRLKPLRIEELDVVQKIREKESGGVKLNSHENNAIKRIEQILKRIWSRL